MGYITVKFLGEEYQISETINDFLDYDKLLTPIRTKMLNMITTDVKRDSRLSWNGDTITSHVHGTADKYRKLINDGAELLVKKLLELGVYDVTSNDLLQDISSVKDINKLENDTFTTLLREGRKIADMKRAGIENAYRYASSNITGSGVRVFTSSFSTLVIHSAVERSIVMSQAKKADQEYQDAVRNLNSNARDALDTVYREVMVKEFYPTIMEIMLAFDNKIMSLFLAELATRGKFDFESIEKYNMRKAEEMLKNIDKVPDKVAFLKQTFITCPFGIEVYEECLKQGMLNEDEFEIAKYFGMDEELVEKVEDYIICNLRNVDKIKPMISLLASYQKTNESAIWRKMYEGKLGYIEDTYKGFNMAISDKKNLDKFIRANINQKILDIVKKTREDISKSIDLKINSLVSENQYNEFVSMEILSPETLRMVNSSSTALCDINNEIKTTLVECIMEYIEEAKKRLDTYNKAKDIYDREVKQKEDELRGLKSEKERLGMFAFSKKKELLVAIGSKTNEISEFKRKHEPKDLWNDFENMYR